MVYHQQEEEDVPGLPCKHRESAGSGLSCELSEISNQLNVADSAMTG
jgi:hypothetical protein